MNKNILSLKINDSYYVCFCKCIRKRSRPELHPVVGQLHSFGSNLYYSYCSHCNRKHVDSESSRTKEDSNGLADRSENFLADILTHCSAHLFIRLRFHVLFSKTDSPNLGFDGGLLHCSNAFGTVAAIHHSCFSLISTQS